MKNIFNTVLIFVFIFTANHVFSQLCYTMIFPWPGMTKITTNQPALNSPSGEAFWICSGVTVNVVNSAGSLFICEEDVTMIFTNTSGDDVFAKNGSTIINNSNGSVAVQCDTTQVTLQNNANGTLVVTSHCPALTYDYTLVGGNTCQGITGIYDFDASDDMVILYPNPASDHLLIQANLNIENIEITDQIGKTVTFINQPENNVLNFKNLNPGSYFVTVTLDNQKKLTRSLIVE